MAAFAAFESSNSEQEITALFDEWDADSLEQYYSQQTSRLVDFSFRVMDVCLIHIAHENPAHITNEKMNNCFLNFPQWAVHISPGKVGIVWKLIQNGEILHHQCKRYEWFISSVQDKTKDYIKDMVHKDNPEQSFIDFFKSMLFIFYRVFYIQYICYITVLVVRPFWF